MPVVNSLARELVFKVVYYGPGLGGKTTSLQHIHATTRAEHRGKMVSLATPVDRTLYFDFLPIRIPSSRDMTIRLQLFTVPGQVYYNATRKLVLTGADGVVFVVDSQRARADANIESLRNLEENLVEHGRALDEIPHVFSYNKRDLPGLVPIDDMERLFNPRGAPSFATVATSGEGVYETLEAITRAVMEDFEQRMPEHRGLGPSALMLPEGGLAEALRMAEDAPERPADRVTSKRAPEALDRFLPELGLSLPPSDDVGEQAARVLAEPGNRLGFGTGEVDSPIELLQAKRLAPRHTAQALPSEPSPEAVVEAAVEDSDDETLESPLDAMSKVVASLAGGLPRAAPEDGHFGSGSRADSRFDTRTMISDTAPRALSERVLEPAVNALAGQATAEQVNRPPGDATSFSLASLWSDDEQATVVRAEEAITFGEYRDCILLVDVLVQRCLEAVNSGLGQPALEPSTLMLMLGMPGESILEFRMLCERSRATGSRLTEDEAKLALLFAVNLRVLMRKLSPR